MSEAPPCGRLAHCGTTAGIPHLPGEDAHVSADPRSLRLVRSSRISNGATGAGVWRREYWVLGLGRSRVLMPSSGS